MRRLLPLLGVVLLVGCSTTRVFTIHTKPPDAAILVDGVDRGKGELTTPIVFAGKEDTHTVTAMRKGYKDTTVKLQKDYPQDAINIEMGYLSRRVTINVTPAAANLSVDGKLITTEASESASVDLEFTVDARDRWTTHTITAEREG